MELKLDRLIVLKLVKSVCNSEREKSHFLSQLTLVESLGVLKGNSSWLSVLGRQLADSFNRKNIIQVESKKVLAVVVPKLFVWFGIDTKEYVLKYESNKTNR